MSASIPICASHRFGNHSYLYDATARFMIVRWKASQYFGGECDETPEMLKWWKISPGDVVIDAGAHIGSWTLPALAMGAKMVYAFEPQTPSVDALNVNVMLNGWEERCVVSQHALWNKSGETLPYYWPITIPLDFADNGWIVSRTEGAVRTVTLDDFVRELDIQKIDWMKVDVDGSEVHLLQGAYETLHRFKPKLLISKHYDILRSIWGRDIDLKDYLPQVKTEEITDRGQFLYTF